MRRTFCFSFDSFSGDCPKIIRFCILIPMASMRHPFSVLFYGFAGDCLKIVSFCMLIPMVSMCNFFVFVFTALLVTAWKSFVLVCWTLWRPFFVCFWRLRWGLPKNRLFWCADPYGVHASPFFVSVLVASCGLLHLARQSGRTEVLDLFLGSEDVCVVWLWGIWILCSVTFFTEQCYLLRSRHQSHTTQPV